MGNDGISGLLSRGPEAMNGDIETADPILSIA
jgi:hypothetical protein